MAGFCESPHKSPLLHWLWISWVLGIVFKPRPNPVLFESRLVPSQSLLSPESSLFTSGVVPLASLVVHVAHRVARGAAKTKHNANNPGRERQGKSAGFFDAVPDS